MAFHEFEGNDSGGVMISLPQWVLENGKENPDIFFTDREGRRNTECLSWGIDKERVLKGRTGIEVLSYPFCIDTCPSHLILSRTLKVFIILISCLAGPCLICFWGLLCLVADLLYFHFTDNLG